MFRKIPVHWARPWLSGLLQAILIELRATNVLIFRNMRKPLLLRAPDGTGGVADGDGTPTGQDGQTTGDGTTTANEGGENTGPDLSFIGEEFHTDGAPDIGKFTEHYQGLLSEKAQFDERAAAVPEDGAYDFSKLPDDFDLGVELDDGTEINIDLENEAMQPLFTELGALMQKHQMPASAAGEMMGMLKRYEATKIAGLQQAAHADYETLGANDATRDARIAQVERAIDAKLPKEHAAALKGIARSSAVVKALEALLKPTSSTTTTAPGAKNSIEADLDAYYANPSS